MSEATLIQEEETSNPYNMNKPWHKPDAEKIETADQLFFEKPKQATPKEAPEEEEEVTPKKRTNYKKRYDDLKRHYDEKLAEFKQREQELLANNARPQYQAPKTQEDLEKFKQEYPDLYDTVETVAHMRSSEQVGHLEEQLKVIKQRESEIIRREAEADLLAKHPDFPELRSSQEFHTWAKEQPEQIQLWVYKNPDNAQLASKAIDLFKLEKGYKTQTKSRSKPRGSAADMVSTKTTTVDAKQPKIWTEREIAAMSLDKFDKHEEEIRQAISEGRVVKG